MNRRSLLERLGPLNPLICAEIVLSVLLLGAVFWFFGADVWHALMISTALTIAGVAVLRVSADTDWRDLSWHPEERRSRRGSRDDITSLSWSMQQSWWMVGRTAESRVRKLARRRLALEGLDLNDPDDHDAIERRLNAPVSRVLVRENIMGLQFKTMLALLDALDGLDPDHYPAPERPARGWARVLNRFQRRENA